MNISHIDLIMNRCISSACMRMRDFDKKGEPIQYSEEAFLDAINSQSPRKIAELLAHLQAQILTLHDELASNGHLAHNGDHDHA